MNFLDPISDKSQISKKLIKVFQKYDISKSGSLEIIQLKSLLEECGIEKSAEAMKEFLEDAEHSKKTVITCEDFINFMFDMMKKDSPSPNNSVKKKNSSGFHRILKKLPGSLKPVSKMAKLLTQVSTEYGMSPKYVHSIYNRIFLPVKQKTGKFEIAEEEFSKFIDGRLGEKEVERKFFKVFDKEGKGIIDFKQFCSTIAFLEHGPENERLSKLFDAYDDDKSGALEFNELQNLFNQLKFMMKQNGEEKDEIDEFIKSVSQKLDPRGQGCVKRDYFIAQTSTIPEFLQRMLPSPLLHLDIWSTGIFYMTEPHGKDNLNSETKEFFKILQLGGDNKRAKELINSKQVDLNAKDKDGNTLLYYCCKENNEIILLILLVNGADPNIPCKGNIYPIHVVVGKGNLHLLRILLENKANTDVQDELGWTPLHKAIKADREENGGGVQNCIHELVKRNANLHIPDKDGCTCLDIAARYGQSEHLEFLAEHGANVNHKSKNDFTPLHWAASGGFATSVKKLIALKADVNAVSGSGATPVHLAALSGNLNSVEKLIEENVDPLQVDSLGRTALHFAVSSGQARCISYLLQIKPAAMRIKDRQGNTPLDLARKTKNQEAIKILSEGPLVSEHKAISKTVLAAFRAKNRDAVKELLKNHNDVDLHAANENGTTLLHYCSMHGFPEALEFLLSKNVNPNIGNSRGTTPLHKACQRGELKCLKLLIQYQADINIQDDEGLTPLHRGIYELGHSSRAKHPKNTLKRKEKVYSSVFVNALSPQSVRKLQDPQEPNPDYVVKDSEVTNRIMSCITELVAKKAKLNLSDNRGFFPLDVAARYGLIEVIDLLVQGGADLQHKNPKTNFTPIHLAAAYGHSLLVNKLVTDYRIPASSPLGDSTSSPLVLAIENNHEETVETILNLKASPTTENYEKKTPIHFAAEHGNSRILQKLLKRGDPSLMISLKDKYGNTPLHYASSIEVIDLLIENGANPNSLNDNDENPLMVSIVLQGSWNLAKELLNHKTSLQQKNKQGLDVLSLSAKVGAEECIQKLTEYGLTFRDYSTKDLKFCEFKCGDLFPQVDSGTLDALIEHCITSNFSDPKYFFAFLVHYRKYLTPLELLEKVINLFSLKSQDVFPLYQLFPEPDKNDIVSFRPSVGIASFLIFWIRYFPSDTEQREVREMLTSFLTSGVLPEKESEMIHIIFTLAFDSSFSRRTSVLHHSDEFNFLEVSNEDFAENMTILEHSLISQIGVEELLGQAWTKKNSTAHNILACVRRFNEVGSWVVNLIISAKKKSIRAKIIQKFIGLAKDLYQLKNYQSVMQILSGLEASAVSRLKKTWAEVGKNSSLIELKKIFNFHNNSKSYRQILSEVKEPCVPFLAILLQDLTFSDEGNENFVDEEQTKINFKKWLLNGQIIFQFFSLLRNPYELLVNNLIMNYIRKLPTITESEAYEKSLILEPRENK